MASLNDKITAAFKITESASPHQMRCPQAMGLGIPDLVTRTAQQRINLALRVFHSNNMEGQALRWCLRVEQGTRSRFPWEMTSFWVPPGVNGFVEAVAHSLQALGVHWDGNQNGVRGFRPLEFRGRRIRRISAMELCVFDLPGGIVMVPCYPWGPNEGVEGAVGREPKSQVQRL
jgi:hypothetical protein